jgi:hypothetical protein
LRVTDLRALRDKYERMNRLRELHERARADADFVEPDPRAAMAALARAFPGALREIDELPIEVIRARIAELSSAEDDPSLVTPWMVAHARFHALARGALAAKRWLHGRPLTPELVATFARMVAALPEGDDAAAWAGDLASIAKPPRGRLMDLVYARLALELDIDVAAARDVVTPHARASLRRRRPRGRSAG